MSFTTPNGTLPEAGWYADPQNAAQLRWWDGAQWGTHTAPVPEPVAPVAPAPRYGEYASATVQPYGSQQYAAQPDAGQGYATPSYPTQPYAAQPYSMTPENPRVAEGTPTAGWQIWGMALLPLVSLLILFGWDFESYLRMSLDNPGTVESMLLLDPGYILVSLASWALAAAMIVLAVLDWRWLGRQGYPRRFHWAWSILSSLVYLIGRAVVVKRQAGSGLAPMWVAIGVTVLGFVVTIIWTIQLMNSIFAMLAVTPGIAS